MADKINVAALRAGKAQRHTRLALWKQVPLVRKMLSHLAALENSEEAIIDHSTAPTTPDGSLTFSPVLQALKLHDALEDAAAGQAKMRTPSGSLSVTPPGVVVKNICCIGAGYVGGPTAAVMAYQNPHIKITVVDRDASRIARWNSKHLPIYEPGLEEILRIARDGSRAVSFVNERQNEAELGMSSDASSTGSECDSGCVVHSEKIVIPARSPNLFFSTEVSHAIGEADIILVAVNTPTKMHGLGAGSATDVAALEAVTKQIALYARPGAILVEKSTVPCKTAELMQEILHTHRPNIPFTILSNPEFLAAGTAISNLMNPDRVLIGSTTFSAGSSLDAAAAALASVYSWVPSSRIITTNIYSSELAKLVANSMLAQRISSINSISAICDATGANIDEIALSIGMDRRIGAKYLKAGIGFGGSCFKKDILSLVYLAESLHLGEVAEYWMQVLRVNEWQRHRFVQRIVQSLNSTLRGKKIAILGYAFKPDTSDTRESPALEVIKQLLLDQPAQIAVYDPCCSPEVMREEIDRLVGAELVTVESEPYAACEGAHALVVCTDCDEFKHGEPVVKQQDRGSDPRPFESTGPSEGELLELQRFLRGNGNANGKTGGLDPLGRMKAERACEEGCGLCGEGVGEVVLVGGKKERLDWRRVVCGLEMPRWVFDGKGVLERGHLEGLGLGVKVVGVGR